MVLSPGRCQPSRCRPTAAWAQPSRGRAWPHTGRWQRTPGTAHRTACWRGCCSPWPVAGVQGVRGAGWEAAGVSRSSSRSTLGQKQRSHVQTLQANHLQLSPGSTHHTAAGLAGARPEAVGARAACPLLGSTLPVGLARLALNVTLRVGWVQATHHQLLLLLHRLRCISCRRQLLRRLGDIGCRPCRDRWLLLLAACTLSQLSAHGAAPARHPRAAISSWCLAAAGRENGMCVREGNMGVALAAPPRRWHRTPSSASSRQARGPPAATCH